MSELQGVCKSSEIKYVTMLSKPLATYRWILKLNEIKIQLLRHFSHISSSSTATFG